MKNWELTGSLVYSAFGYSLLLSIRPGMLDMVPFPFYANESVWRLTSLNRDTRVLAEDATLCQTHD